MRTLVLIILTTVYAADDVRNGRGRGVKNINNKQKFAHIFNSMS